MKLKHGGTLKHVLAAVVWGCKITNAISALLTSYGFQIF